MNHESPKHSIHISRGTWKRLGNMLRLLWKSDQGLKAKWLFGTLLGLLVVINALNVVNSYVGRYFMTSIEARDMPHFVSYATMYLGVFAGSTVAAVMYRFAEERLGLLWRAWFTARAVTRYMSKRTYFHLKETGFENPDQRIAEDIKAMTVQALSFMLLLLSASFTVVSFAGVMWSISPLLFFITVGYAALGSMLTVVFGKSLVWLNYNQLDREAGFRADLIHVRENAEVVALARREGRLEARVLRRLEDLVANMKKIIGVNRNLGFFTTGYNYLIQIIPALVVAPLFIQGKVEFGVITQSAMAFTHLIGAFSLIVTQFQTISSFTAVVARLSALGEAIESTRERADWSIRVVVNDDRVAFRGLTLRTSGGDPLVSALSAEIPAGTRVLVRGNSDAGKTALFRATASMLDWGEGIIVRPVLDHILFLPERPYLPPVPIRDFLLRTGREQDVPDANILAVLRTLALGPIVEKLGGLGAEVDWDDTLSLGEQQKFAVARVILAAPRFVFIDRLYTTLGAREVDEILRMLHGVRISYLNIGYPEEPEDLYDAALEIEPGGKWSWRPLRQEPRQPV